MVLTTRDELVAPHKQRELAEAARAEVFEVALMHMELSWRGADYNPALLKALAAVAPAGAERGGRRTRDVRVSGTLAADAQASARRPADHHLHGAARVRRRRRSRTPRAVRAGTARPTTLTITNAMFLVILFFPTVIIVSR